MVEQALCPVIVGRDDELATLEEALFGASRGDGRVVALAGDAGLGKTRVATEIARRARALGCAVLWGGCTEADFALPYLPFLEATGNWLAGQDVARVRERLGPAAGELAQLFPQLGEPQAASAAGDPSQAKLRLYESVVVLLQQAAGERGLLLVIEDLHWADASTRELLDYMTRRVRAMPIMILVTYRADELHRRHPLLPIVQGWRRSRRAQIVEMDGLAADDIGRMVGAIFDESSVSEEFRDFMFARSEGNPFVLEEMLKEAVDRGDIYRTGSGWDRKSLSELRVPRSVSEGILFRVERLDPGHAEVLRAAAVLGHSFDYRTLVALTGASEADVQDALRTCVQQQLLDEDRTTQNRYRFRHALTRESVYDDLIAPRRQQLHARAAEVLREHAGVSASEIAGHLLNAGRFEEAAPFCIEAADLAMARVAYEDATQLYERALPYLSDPVARADVLGRLGEAYMGGIDLPMAERYIREAIQVMDTCGEAGKAASRRLTLGRLRWMAGDAASARAEYERAREALEQSGPSADLAVTYIRLSGLHAFDLQHDVSRDFARRAIEVAEAAGADEARLWAYGFLGLSLVGLGEEDEGFVWFSRSVDEALARGFVNVATNSIHNTTVCLTETGRALDATRVIARLKEVPRHDWSEFSETFLAGIVSMFLGAADESERLLEGALRLVEGQWGAGVGANWCHFQLANVYTEQDRLDDARSLLPPAGQQAEKQDMMQVAQAWIRLLCAANEHEAAVVEVRNLLATGVLGRGGHIVSHAAEAATAVGDVDLARRFIDAVSVGPDRGAYPYTSQALGRVALAEGKVSEAASLLGRTAERFTDIGYRVDEGRTRLVLAEALVALGDREGAAAELARILERSHGRGLKLVERRVRETAEALRLEVPWQPPSSAPAATVVAGERLVTVMFADVRGYTAMTNRSAPAEMAERMTSFYRWARHEVERHGGAIDQYLGDAVMASFNVSRTAMDHSVQAIQAALAMHDKAAVEGLPLGVGIAAGAAIVGTLTGGAGLDVIGQTTNLASRLQAQAEPGEIVLDEQAFRRVRSWLEEKALAVEERAIELKGFDAPVAAYVVRARG